MDINYLIRKLSLKDMGEALLVSELEYRANTLGFLPMLSNAIHLASYLHRDQRRANRGTLPKDTYITHPLRNALRLMRYGVVDPDIIVAVVLHDTVEDCAEEMVDTVAVFTLLGGTPQHYRTAALRFLSFDFGKEVARLVSGMTNPILLDDFSLSKDEKREVYRSHVREAIKDPKTAVGKLSDFVDNAVGLYHNTGMLPQVRFHLASKYQPLIVDFIERVQEADVVSILTPSGKSAAIAHLEKGALELESIIYELD